MAAVSRTGGIAARAAYLDLCDPDLTQVAQHCRAAGWSRAVVVPLLFTQAFHATVDVPDAVRAATEETGLEMVVADIIGTGDDMVAILAEVLRDRAVSDDSSVLVFSVGSSDPAANAAVHDLAERLAATRRGVVRAAFATTEPRADNVLAELTAQDNLSQTQVRGDHTLAILPLFVSPGLLLDALAQRAAQQGWLMADPLETRLAPVVWKRFRQALGLDPAPLPIA